MRLRLSKALLGAGKAQALAAESIAIARGVSTEKIAQAEGLALHADAFNGIPDPVLHFTARAMGIVTGLAAIGPDPWARDRDAILDAALRAAAGLAKLLGFRGDCVTATTLADQAQATAKLVASAAELTAAAEAVTGLLELARITAASGRVPASKISTEASAATSLRQALEGAEELLAPAEVLRRARLGRNEPPAAGRATILTLRTSLSCPDGPGRG